MRPSTFLATTAAVVPPYTMSHSHQGEHGISVDSSATALDCPCSGIGSIRTIILSRPSSFRTNPVQSIFHRRHQIGFDIGGIGLGSSILLASQLPGGGVIFHWTHHIGTTFDPTMADPTMANPIMVNPWHMTANTTKSKVLFTLEWQKGHNTKNTTQQSTCMMVYSKALYG